MAAPLLAAVVVATAADVMVAVDAIAMIAVVAMVAVEVVAMVAMVLLLVLADSLDHYSGTVAQVMVVVRNLDSQMGDDSVVVEAAATVFVAKIKQNLC